MSDTVVGSQKFSAAGVAVKVAGAVSSLLAADYAKSVVIAGFRIVFRLFLGVLFFLFLYRFDRRFLRDCKSSRLMLPVSV